MLLHWCTLEPSGPSNLAAVRFVSPIRVHSIRIFPTNAQPFVHCPELLAHTEPEAFFLDVFFNAHPMNPESKDRQRAPNALVPTIIAYAGGQMDFMVDMGAEHSTRLIIIKGNFQSVSMSIYGALVTEDQPPIQPYKPRQLSSINTRPLTCAIDPLNAADPTLLARQLLALISDAPPLSLVVRLMMCLKPSNDDWDNPGFPYLYTDLLDCTEDFDLAKAFHSTSKPIADDTPLDLIQRFSEKVAASIGPKSSHQSSLVAGILCQIAPQHPDMARILMDHLDLESIFDSYNMDKLTITRLLDASANVDIARRLCSEWFFGVLHTIQGLPSANKEMQWAARRLAARIQGWQVLEDALSNTRADFNAAAGMMKDIGSEENSFGIWLETMVAHRDILTKLAENPVLPNPQCPPSLFLIATAVSHDDFIAFVRAYVGVSSVLAVYAWSDSLPNVRCRERALGILRLWQGVDGYREIVNHLLLLRQMIFRLECLTEDHDPPSPSLVHVEHILVNLANDPSAILRPDLAKCILSLRQPLSYITEDERLTMRKVALVADYGLPVAIEELTASVPYPMDMRNLRILRVSLAIIEQAFEDKNFGEWRVFQALWNEGKHGLISHLVDIFVGVSGDLKGYFLLTPPAEMPQKLVEQLFQTAADVLRLIASLIFAYPPVNRSTRVLTAAVADVFASAGAAAMLYSQSNPMRIAALGTRQTSIDLVRCLSEPRSSPESSEPVAEIVLRTLLEHGVRGDGRDPAYYLLQVYYLIEQFLPPPTAHSDEYQRSNWVTSVIPSVLPEMRSFLRVLDNQNKLHLIKHLVELDDGVVGIGEWLLLEELRRLHHVLQSLNDDMAEQLRLVGHYEIFLCLRFLLDLATTSRLSLWCITTIQNIPDVAQTLAQCLMYLLDAHLSSLDLSQFAHLLSSSCATFDPNLRFTLAITLLRMTRDPEVPPSISDLVSTSLHIFSELPHDVIDLDRLDLEIGQTLSAIAESLPEGLNVETAEAVMSFLEWVSELYHPHSSIFPGITVASFMKLCDSIRLLLPSNRINILFSLGTKINVETENNAIAMSTDLSGSIQLSIQDLQDLLYPSEPTPSTPKRNTPDLLSLVTISPPTAVLRSPAATGLTKTYSNNDFRQLRQLPSARQNTSRLPSMHVDDFESSPVLVPVSMPEVYLGLSPTFNT